MAAEFITQDLDYQKTHLAVAAIENAAIKLDVSSSD